VRTQAADVDVLVLTQGEAIPGVLVTIMVGAAVFSERAGCAHGGGQSVQLLALLLLPIIASRLYPTVAR
jgi:hypothetical protein